MLRTFLGNDLLYLSRLAHNSHHLRLMALHGNSRVWFSSNRGLVEACNFIGGIGLTPAEITSPVDLLTRISWGITTKPPRTRPNPTGCTVIIILLEGHFWDNCRAGNGIK